MAKKHEPDEPEPKHPGGVHPTAVPHADESDAPPPDPTLPSQPPTKIDQIRPV